MTIARGTYPATEFTASADDVVDVVVIGSGPSGATVTKELTAMGFHVVCLEQGRWIDTHEYTGTRDEYELSTYGRWHSSSNVRAMPEDYPLNLADSDVSPVMYNAVGGGSIHFGAYWHRYMPSDFKLRSLYGVADDWPISWEDLAPHYDAVDKDFAAAAMHGDTAFPVTGGTTLPPHPINDYGRLFAQGMNAKGWHWWPASNAIANTNTKGLVPCVRLGVCEAGCPNGSKASVDITHWPISLKQGATLVTGARARELTVDKDGLVNSAIFLDNNGREHRIKADLFVMAANGIGTSRLLQLSTSSRFPDGLANSSGLVGRRLMLNPTAMAVGVFDQNLASWFGPAGNTAHSFQFGETDASRGHVLGASWGTSAAGGPVAAYSLSTAAGGARAGAGMMDGVRNILGRSVLMSICTSDLPNENNRVTLDPVLTDSHGIPAPRIEYTKDQNSKDLIEFHLDRATEALEAAGAVQVLRYPEMPDQPGHILGTARMGTDPTRSVVDGYGRTHDVPNLFIVDGSVFPSVGTVGPTNTISAFARRTAHHIVDHAMATMESEIA
ncbi:GMC family oxidoreductase [Arthrobacter sp. 18067]|uniref:GMC family oxidoreductase n=1 Tax=Arthrobacter sp. 18067 TaxID=2681413 RepID=UPI00190F57AF|nr:GMC family oxidoreductase [Arthrobacter sp. 18067]